MELEIPIPLFSLSSWLSTFCGHLVCFFAYICGISLWAWVKWLSSFFISRMAAGWDEDPCRWMEVSSGVQIAIYY